MNKKLFIIFYLFMIVFQKSYITLLPSLPVYPNNYDESILVLKEMEKDQELFYLTDKTVATAFINVIPETPEDIERVMVSQNFIILFFKYLINRPRPQQVNPRVIPLESTTAATPAYPSGHSYQAFLIANHYSKKYPQLKDRLYSIAEQCGQARVRAGLHYPSDHEFAKKLVGIINGRGQEASNEPYRF